MLAREDMDTTIITLPELGGAVRIRKLPVAETLALAGAARSRARNSDGAAKYLTMILLLKQAIVDPALDEVGVMRFVQAHPRTAAALLLRIMGA